MPKILLKHDYNHLYEPNMIITYAFYMHQAPLPVPWSWLRRETSHP
jgi:hypothetical protein